MLDPGQAVVVRVNCTLWTDEGPPPASVSLPPEKGDAPLSGYRADARRKGGRSKMTELDGDDLTQIDD